MRFYELPYEPSRVASDHLVNCGAEYSQPRACLVLVLSLSRPLFVDDAAAYNSHNRKNGVRVDLSVDPLINTSNHSISHDQIHNGDL